METSDRWISVTLRTALLALFLWMARGMLIPVALGGLLALMLYPIQERVAPRLGRFKRFAPAGLTISALVLFVIPLVLIVIEAALSINRFLTRDWSQTIERIQAFVSTRMQGVTETFGVSSDNIREYLGNLLQQAGSSLAGLAGGLAAALPASILEVFLFAVALYYFLRDGDALSRWMRRLSPFQPERTEELFASIRETVRGSVLGMLATAVVQGTLTTIALFLFKVPGAFLLGVLATMLSVVPMVGTTPVTVGSAIYLLVVGRFGAAAGMAVSAVVIGLSDNVVRPWVQSSRGGMHPLIALVSIFGGLELFGFPGLFIGPVLGAMVVWTIDTYASRKAGGRPMAGQAGEVGAPPS